MSNESQSPSLDAPPAGARNGQLLSDAMRERLIDSRLTPNKITFVGLLGNIAATVLITQDLWVLAGIAFIFGSVMDLLDGHYSRMSGKATLFGAFIDSTLDRVEEGMVLAAIAAQFASEGDELAVVAVVAAVVGSLMVSYTRARAEALGIECKVGVATRAVRVAIISIGLILAEGAGIFDVELLAPSMYVLAGLTLFTMLQRIWHVYREANKLDAERAAAQVG
jgi:CDP-diacylglycerol--glycerol-3-phosphate 3-phosphatidyltransferase